MSEYLKTLNEPVVVLGLVASLVVLVSMCFSTTTRTGALLMRSVNLLASVLCVIYGWLLGPAGLGTFLLNTVLVFVNIYHFIKVFKKNRQLED